VKREGMKRNEGKKRKGREGGEKGTLCVSLIFLRIIIYAGLSRVTKTHRQTDHGYVEMRRNRIACNAGNAGKKIQLKKS